MELTYKFLGIDGKDLELTVKQVAYLLGFSSEYYFNQFFKSMEGCPPGRYHETF